MRPGADNASNGAGICYSAAHPGTHRSVPLTPNRNSAAPGATQQVNAWTETFATFVVIVSGVPGVINSMLFNQLGLSAELLRAVDEKGYQTATPIQQQILV